MSLLHKNITDQILKSFYTVYHDLGYGFLEKVNENALSIELQNNGLSCTTQKPIEVYYDGCVFGKYYADIIVEDKVIIELKKKSMSFNF